MGVLPIEVVLYRLAAERLRTAFGVRLGEMVLWTPARLEDAWAILGLGIENVTIPAAVNVRDAIQLDALVREASARGRGPDPTDIALATLRRELPYAAEEQGGTLRPEFAANLDTILANAEERIAAEKRR